MREKTKAGEWGDVTDSWAAAVCAVWVCLGAVVATALAHALVCRRRSLSNNRISTIANGAFGGLTALTLLYVAGL